MASPQELPAPIHDLRQAMERVRSTQVAAGIAINMARYNAETDPINKEFLADFLNILPLQIGHQSFESTQWHAKTATRFLVTDALDIRPTLSFGLFTPGGYDERPVNIIIGQKPSSEPGLTDVLTVGWHRDTDEKKKWTKSYPVVRTFSVLTSRWDELRDEAIKELATPPEESKIMNQFSSELGLFVIKHTSVLTAPYVNNAHIYNDKNAHITRALKKAEKRGSAIGAKDFTERSLRSSDFEDYDVMRHLEYVAAAYAVGEKFDHVKTKREEKMPKHPAQTMFGMPDDYRPAIEQASLYTTPRALS